MTREETIVYLGIELTAMYPDNGVRVRKRNILGENIYVLYTHFSNALQCANGILENDPAFMHFCIEQVGKDWVIEHPVMHSYKLVREHGLKFRKIRGKTEQEAAEKLVKWFAKNQDIINKAGQ